ncbi:MAG: tRNA 2-thiouridine(34) synthase MnmA [Candidatus Bipolaricaulis sp.]|nr:tRNA 2-thiouridine(34) synthase MnmA [Candidatus Bipolaricaulis sp.]MDD5646151.1 tRNA 2-thiouridine(34) synthase MnmA [Candidatus Bipolaricaulis sp.]
MRSVVVCLSGGVDSAVAAHLLKQQGYDVVGLTFWLWSFSRAPQGQRMSPCCSLDAAAQAARDLGIPHDVVDRSDAFEQVVLAEFARRHRRGETPNPCGRCNRSLRFDAALEYARDKGFDYVATGHHVRIRRESDGRFALCRGRDPHKDQSYFLYGLRPEQLPRLLFPVGELEKREVFALARRERLSAAERPESQDLCFAVAGSTSYLFDAADFPPGDVVDRDGRVLGMHDGLLRYTIGQRRGLGIASDQPMYVLDLDVRHNQLVVGPEDGLYASSLNADEANYLDDPPAERTELAAKIRYRSPTFPATFSPQAKDAFTLDFDPPQRAVTPGQLAVLYDGERLVGGGTIRSRRAGPPSQPL